MDGTRGEQAAFRPDRRTTACVAAGGVVAVLVAALGSDPAGRLLAAVAALVLGAYATADLVFAPRLVVTADGITIRSPLLRARLEWRQVEEVRVDERIRLGLRSATLEIGAGPVLAVFSRRALNTDPYDVAELIAAFRSA